MKQKGVTVHLCINHSYLLLKKEPWYSIIVAQIQYTCTCMDIGSSHFTKHDVS